MTALATDDRAALARELDAFEQGALNPDAFDHATHVRVAFAMCGRYPFEEALARYGRGLRTLCARAGRPEKYHVTITVAFLALVAQRRAAAGDVPWDDFAARNADLLDRGCLARWYDRATLSTEHARHSFVLPPPARGEPPASVAGVASRASAGPAGSGDQRPAPSADLAWFRVVYVACIAAMSVQAMAGAASFADHHAWLAALEIVAAALLLPRRTRLAGLVVLLLVYAVAAVVTLHLGRLPIYLLLYAASAVLVARGDHARTTARP